MLNGSPLALAKCSLVRSQYFVGIIPPLIQFWFAPLSMKATVLIEKSLTTSLTTEYHFWNVTFKIVCKNWVSETSMSWIPEMLWERLGVEGPALRDSSNESFVSISRSLVLRKVTSVLRSWTWDLRSLIFVCNCLVVICWKGLVIG